MHAPPPPFPHTEASSVPALQRRPNHATPLPLPPCSQPVPEVRLSRATPQPLASSQPTWPASRAGGGYHTPHIAVEVAAEGGGSARSTTDARAPPQPAVAAARELARGDG